MALLSKVVKSGCVEDFDWKYMDRDLSKKSEKQTQKEVKDIQAILINPKWADHGFDPETQDIKANSTYDHEATRSACSQQSANSDTPVQPQKGKRLNKLNDKEKQKAAKKESFATNRGAFRGITIDDFRRLQIPKEVMKEGMLFIWTEKELIAQIIRHFEPQGFQYVENMVYVMLD